MHLRPQTCSLCQATKVKLRGSHPLYSALSSIGGKGDLVGWLEADMDFTWRGLAEASAEEAPGDTEEPLPEADISVRLKERRNRYALYDAHWVYYGPQKLGHTLAGCSTIFNHSHIHIVEQHTFQFICLMNYLVNSKRSLYVNTCPSILLYVIRKYLSGCDWWVGWQIWTDLIDSLRSWTPRHTDNSTKIFFAILRYSIGSEAHLLSLPLGMAE